MSVQEQLLISLEERHARNILSGVKLVELRRRRMRVKKGDLVWLYVKKPVGAVVGFVSVAGTVNDSPEVVWKKFGNVSGLVRSEFLDYFFGANAAFALKVTSPKTLRRPVMLSELRETHSNFHPPQFYSRISGNSSLHKLLKTCSPGPESQ